MDFTISLHKVILKEGSLWVVMKILLPILTVLVASPLLISASEIDIPQIKKSQVDPIAASPAVEICFVLDTTGSMSGLIAAAKLKIWSIANETVSYKPKEIRFGLIGYRDRGDQYITQKTELTNDLDAVHAALAVYSAGGGGDGPESVNQALKEAVSDIKWSCLLYTSPSPRDQRGSRMPSSA